MNDTARSRSINARDGVRTASEPAGRPRSRDPLVRADATATVDDRRTDPGLDRWSPALLLGLAFASPRTALFVARLLGPRLRRGPDA